MSYRPPEQALTEPIGKISIGIDGFCAAVLARAKTGDWEEEHIDKINTLAGELRDIQIRLLRVGEANW
jgi:hypothetical protein